ncbi:hypothetical protein [Lachnobacterium bovis]|uniref:hypothetical protein n=1 Tax=Lachnobacterium bovis TaxID=140626 RepID=UPI0003B54005|nr:hypothetical protein [Lachnobacterium bovis]
MNNQKFITDHFKHLNIDFYPNVLFRDLINIRSKQYNFFIVDMGVLNQNILSEFLRHDVHFVIGYSNKIKASTFNNYIDFILSPYDIEKSSSKSALLKNTKTTLLSNLGLPNDIKSFSKQYHYSLNSIPFFFNPFHLTSAEWKFFQDLTKDFM